jgi:hypothetical protein
MDGTGIWKIVEDMGTDPGLAILSFIVAVISLILACIFYKKSRKIKFPCYTVKSHNLIKDFINEIDALQIIYAGSPIKNFTISRIVFWNAGNDTINKNDIVDADPIAIYAKNNNKLLRATIIKCIEGSNKFKLGEIYNDNKLNIDFDYIDENNGIAIQVFHTGKTDSDIEVCGKIKGVGKVILVNINNYNILYILKLLAITILAPIALISLILWGLHPFLSNSRLIVAFVGISILWLLVPLSLIGLVNGRFPHIINTTFNKIMGREPEELQ